MKKKILSDFRGNGDRTGPAVGKKFWEDLTEGERFTCRPVAFDRGGGLVHTPVLGREAVGPGSLRGPLIVESYDSTIVVSPGAAVATDPCGDLVLTLDA